MFDEERCKFVASVIMSINNSLSSLMALYFIFGGRNAEIFLLASIFILGYCLIFLPILPESPKLLFSLKKYEDTREVLSKIAQINGIRYHRETFPEEYEKHGLLKRKDPELVHEIEKEDETKGDFTVLFKNPKFFLNMCITIFVFMFNVFSMYMLSFMVKYLPGD
jgi:hypothetical protein